MFDEGQIEMVEESGHGLFLALEEGFEGSSDQGLRSNGDM
jgi:hypothetical protein